MLLKIFIIILVFGDYIPNLSGTVYGDSHLDVVTHALAYKSNRREVQIIVGAQHVVPLPVYFIYLQYAVTILLFNFQGDSNGTNYYSG
ncbi:hypothetical protein CDG77_04265 [Nostoc sp. 'Peltigera membranacea cyanobiont' 213]|nr:hypothetical protein CDG77_04265 [Nostoc sp. 'Peltigera membranacea cyanobiont' 213]